MKYVSIDIETTGLDHTYCQMIEFGAVLDDLRSPRDLDMLPRFHCYILRDRYVGEPYALAMHADIFKRIAKREPGYKYYTPEEAREKFARFLFDQKYLGEGFKRHEINVAGKNFDRFDYRFLENDGFTKSMAFEFFRRVMDPAHYYFNPKEDDKLPGLNDCLKRAGFNKEVDHTSIGDALDVIKVVREYHAPKYRE